MINDQYRIISEELKISGKKKRPWLKVECLHCGAIYKSWKQAIQRKAKCQNCLNTNKSKPAALKTDDEGNCVTICRMGQLEYIHRLITEEGMTQQGAVESFVEAVQAHSNDGDPITNELTVEMVRSQYRRDSGKLKEKPKNSLVESTKGTTVTSSVGFSNHTKTKVHRIVADLESVQSFLDQYLPGYKIVSNETIRGHRV